MTSELVAAVELARRHDDKVLIEEGIDGVEVECGVLGNRDPIASVVGEIVAHADWYDYSAKYDEGGMDLVIPARIPEDSDARVRELAVESFVATECEGMARIDFFVRPDGEVIVNEINTIPGFTATSVYAKLFEAAGISYAELLDRLIALALERHERRVAARLLDAGEQALGLRAMPLEAELHEELVRAGKELVVATGDAERAKRKGLDDRSGPATSSGASCSMQVVPTERDESVESRREDPRPPYECALDGKLDERLHRPPVIALQRDPDPRAAQVRLVALAGEP